MCTQPTWGGGPVKVYVFPEPVWPKVKMVQEKLQVAGGWTWLDLLRVMGRKHGDGKYGGIGQAV